MSTKTSSSRPTAQRSATSHTSSHPHRSPRLSTSTASTTKQPSSAVSSPPPTLPPRSPLSSVSSKIVALRSPGILRETQTPRTPSPNYFGLTVEPSSRDGVSALPKDNWSPPTSSIRSFNPQTPQHLPVDSNPAFEAFRRQAEANGTFALSHGNLAHFASTPGIEKAAVRPSSRRKEHASPRTQTRGESVNRMDVDDPEASFFPPASSQQSVTAKSSASFFDLPHQQSPISRSNVSHHSPQPSRPPTSQLRQPSGDSFAQPRNLLSRLDDRHPRLSLPQSNVAPPTPERRGNITPQRAEILPPSLQDGGPSFITPAQLKQVLKDSQTTEYLLLDLRVAPQYSQYRINDALNLCIPTTLLKRPSFNVEKLKETFKVEEEKARFAEWKQCLYIIVYDARSSEKKDALSAVNTLKKFENEGWTGKSSILRGGIEQFKKEFPSLIDHRSSHEMHAGTDDALPVAGGCQMPETKNNGANPFFSNIRQNMDLVGGVGQISLKVPTDTKNAIDEVLPKWLAEACEPVNKGKRVADKFLRIEEAELSRMQRALSSRVSYGTPQTASINGERAVQIAGFEKGSKNRYNNIWPFEHSRVKLHRLDRSGPDCDYINASYIKAEWSNKRYIASQGPLPATFEDFWSVIWDEDVRVIVMLTAETEGGQLKCHSYWTDREYGQFKLKALSEKRVSLDPRVHRRHSSTRDIATHHGDSSTNSPKDGAEAREAGRSRAYSTAEGTRASEKEEKDKDATPYVVVRKFTLAHATEPFKPMREITQLHYSSWPDFGAPAQPSHLLGLVELSNSMQRSAMLGSSASSTSLVSHNSQHSTHNDFGGGSNGSGGGGSGSVDTLRSSKMRLGSSADPEENGAARPMLVHCSAGCGRTGTFCTVDSVIDMLKRQRKEFRAGVTPMETEGLRGSSSNNKTQDMNYWSKGKPAATHVVSDGGDAGNAKEDFGFTRAGDSASGPDGAVLDDSWIYDQGVDLVEHTVQDFRRQRISMVQSLVQYVLCYETVAEWVGQQRR